MSRAAHAAFGVLFAVQVAVFSTAHPAPTASLAGTWTFDPYVSDHPQQVARVLRVVTGEEPAAGMLGGRAGRESPGHSGGGRGDVGGGRYGESSGGRPPEAPTSSSKETASDSDRGLLAELTSAVRFPPATLTIAQTDSVVSMTPEAGTTVTFRTDGKAEKQQLASGAVERTASWEGPQLVVAYRVGRSGTLVCRYALAPTTGQLVVRVTFERTPGEPGPFEVKQIYDPPRMGAAR